MSKEATTIKILLKYYNFSKEEMLSNSTNNDLCKTASNSNIAINNQNYLYNTNSLNSNEKSNNIIGYKKKSKDSDKMIYNNFINELTQDYLIYFQMNYPYNDLESNNSPKVINIKSCIYLFLIEKKKLNITLDSILLYKFNQNKYQLLNDEEYFNFDYINKDNTNIDANNTNNAKCDENNISNSTVIYYNINKDKIKVIVELYSKSVDHISLTISKMCSILMLKYLILLKLREIAKTKKISKLIEKSGELINNNVASECSNIISFNEIENELKIYGNGIVNNNFNDYLSKKETNRNFSNNMLIFEIYSYYINNIETSLRDNKPNNISKNSENISISISKDDLNDGILNFIMMEKKEKKCCLGLDFRFTILQNFIPITEEDKNIKMISTKNYVKPDSITKYGLNLYFNCLNKNCIYNTECFMLNVGYGNYDIFNLIKYNGYCPMCFISKKEFFNEKNKKNTSLNSNNNLDLKYIGMVNSKWAFKGYLIGIKMTNVEGKGMTVIRDILYKTKEFDFLHQFKKLVFQIDRYNPKNKYTPIEAKSDSSLCSIDFKNLNDDNKKNINNIKNNNQIINLKTEENIVQDIPNQILNEDKNIIKISTIDISNNNINEDEKNKSLLSNKLQKEINDNINNVIKNEQKKIDNIIHNNINSSLNNNIHKYIDNINKSINNKFEYKYLTKKLNIKRNINLNRKANNSKGIYYGNSKQVIQNGDGNETNNTNVDFNIIIDKKKSNCCESCFDCQTVSQACCIY